MSTTEWTPVPFNFLEGNPFQYSEHSISRSATTATEAFATRIEQRDRGRCVVCGVSARCILKPTHIVARGESYSSTWEEMRKRGFIPRATKSAVHEARNGVLMCLNHNSAFDADYFYIRWMPEAQRFILVNHSREHEHEKYHGRAIRLVPGDSHVPFHGSFLMHEMLVRGKWPFRADRSIALPIEWPAWDRPAATENVLEGPGAVTPPARALPLVPPNTPIVPPNTGLDCPAGDGAPVSPQAPTGKKKEKKQAQTWTPTNPFANPADLEALKHSFAQQPNWKAAVVEGETWEGSAEENIAKWRANMDN